ncbi:MAG: hypothetical protein ROO76_00170 [Terriglobia bacterium]|jgi:hypothetical protein|nr:hypothetical protein [Terriglobia bacterium]
MPKKMKITANSVIPNVQDAARYEPVELTAEEECIVLLGLGLGIKLHKTETCKLAATATGHHRFDVVYLRDGEGEPETMIMQEEKVAVAGSDAGGGVALMSGATTLLNAAAAGPTGDIHVP